MVDLPQSSNRRPLREDELQELLNMYSILYPSEGITKDSLSRLCNTFADIQVGAEHYGSQLYRRSNKLSSVIAYWIDDDGQICGSKPLRHDFKPGKVSYFLQHRVKIGSVMVLHILAYIKWFKPVEYRQDVYQKPTSVWQWTNNLHRNKRCRLFVHCHAEYLCDSSSFLLDVLCSNLIYCRSILLCWALHSKTVALRHL